MSKLVFNRNSLQGNAKRETLNGQEHLVLPVIGMREGVMNGMFYSADQIQANVETWAGVPIPVGHPMKDGKHVSANDPEIESNTNIGTVYNPRFDNGELKAEFWINIDKAKSLGFEDLVTRLEAGETVDVSTGLRNTPIDQAGIYNNTSYTRVANDIRPDHLAILPDEKGACSVADGCGTGAFVANKGDDSGFKPKPCCGGCGEGKPCEGEKEPKQSVIDLAVNKFREFLSHGGGQGLISEADKKTGATDVAVNNDKTMKAKLIKEIIANAASKFGEGDQETLEALEVNVLEGIHGLLPAPKKEVSANSDTITLNAAQFAEFKEFQINSRKEREGLVKKVKEGYGLEDEQLAQLSVNALKSFADKLDDQGTDYSGQGGSKEIETNKSKGSFKTSDLKID